LGFRVGQYVIDDPMKICAKLMANGQYGFTKAGTTGK